MSLLRNNGSSPKLRTSSSSFLSPLNPEFHSKVVKKAGNSDISRYQINGIYSYDYIIDVLEEMKAVKLSQDFKHFIKLIKERIKKDTTDYLSEKEKLYAEIFCFIKKLTGDEQEIANIIYERHLRANKSKTPHSITGFQMPSNKYIVSLLCRYSKLPKLQVETLLNPKHNGTSPIIGYDDYNEYGNAYPNYDDNEEPISDYEYFADRYDYRDDY
jgi:hypothetical protein